ncbi:MAG: cytochrome c [Ignavibacteriota bacterium]|jgi:cytochrome c2|nr:cytochrome c [Ignavibacteriota bacterium]MCO6448295.1 cytochrome c [Ignavibacterium album]MDD5608116.1 cytochrome c [Ignavibacterium sp.]MDX9713487.1 cytochrome c [Ignavibacteriaceae bacterium]MEB2355736.1 cytochrome c [Ignavibacteriales bacterium]
MTKPQIWITALLLLFIILLLLGRVTSKEESHPDFSSMNNQNLSEQNTGELTGEKLFQSFGCVTCHGNDLTGSKSGPSLKGIKQYWSSRDNLINYLRNPNSYMDSDRFKDYKEKYPGTIMPPYNNKDVKDLGKIADFLLTQ